MTNIGIELEIPIAMNPISQSSVILACMPTTLSLGSRICEVLLVKSVRQARGLVDRNQIIETGC